MWKEKELLWKAKETAKESQATCVRCAQCTSLFVDRFVSEIAEDTGRRALGKSEKRLPLLLLYSFT